MELYSPVIGPSLNSQSLLLENPSYKLGQVTEHILFFVELSPVVIIAASFPFNQTSDHLTAQRLSTSVTMVTKGVLKEHLLLLGNSMTCAGTLIGFNTGGIKAISKSLNVQVPFMDATLFVSSHTWISKLICIFLIDPFLITVFIVHFPAPLFRPLEDALKKLLKSARLIICQVSWLLVPGANMYLWVLDLLSKFFGTLER